MKMNETGVGVWSYDRQTFIPFIPCPGEKRVRIDVHDDLENYCVWQVEYRGNLLFSQGNEPLADWSICYS